MLPHKHGSGTEQKQGVPGKGASIVGKEPAPMPHKSKHGVLRHFGATRPGVWFIKHLISPLDRWLYQRTGGRRVSTGPPLGPLLLLTTTGHRTGKERTTPLFYLRDGKRLIVCNVNPGFEHSNPWTTNLRAHPLARVQIGPERSTYQAREANETEIDHYWPQLVQIWPAYQAFYDKSGQRLIFLLEPLPSSTP